MNDATEPGLTGPTGDNDTEARGLWPINIKSTSAAGSDG